ncbi:MAG TPA: glycosyltransferase family 4 protein [Sphingomicrobium sp.]
MPGPRRVVLGGNSSWNIVAFRSGLIRALRQNGYEPIVIAPVDAAAEGRMAELGVERIVIEMERSGLNPFADLRLLLQYRWILRRLRPVAYLGFTIKPNIYGSLAARSAGVPAIPNISGLGTVFIKGGPLLGLVTALYRFALRHAPVVFFQNPDDRGLFLERGLVRAGQARLLPGSGVDLDRFRRAPLPTGAITLLFIGRLLGDKGVRELIDAARIVKKDRNIRIQLLGPLDVGNRTAVSRAELDRWIAEGLVDYLGETDDVRPFIAQATAVVLPSYREGLPRSLLEAAAMARPLIATDVPGCREVVEDGVNGFLCRANEPESLARAMLRLAELSADRRSAMGSESRRKVEERFSESVVIAAYLDAIGEVSGSRS